MADFALGTDKFVAGLATTGTLSGPSRVASVLISTALATTGTLRGPSRTYSSPQGTTISGGQFGGQVPQRIAGLLILSGKIQ